MKKRSFGLLSLATALASLGGFSTKADAAKAVVPPEAKGATAVENSSRSSAMPNLLVSTGNDLLGFIIGRQADGTLIATHRSHSSHASHSSHSSHHSSR